MVPVANGMLNTLDSCFYVFGKCSCFRTTMQREFVHFNEIMRSDVYSFNCINLVTGFFYTSLIKTCCAIRASGTVRMHMIPGMIRIGNDREMNSIMSFLEHPVFSRKILESFGSFLPQVS